jgi:class 3 adenylate cyclase
MRRRVRVTAIVVVAVHVAFFVVYQLPRPFNVTWAARLAVVALTAASIPLMRLRALSRRPASMAFALLAGTTAYIWLEISRRGDPDGWQVSGLVLLLVGAVSVLPLTARQSALACVSFVAGFEIFVGARFGWGNWLMADGGIYLGVAAAVAIVISRVLERMRRAEFLERSEVARQKARAEHLLLNILPGTIAEQLKNENRPIADGFSEVTVLFADLVGFTPLAARMPPVDLVRMLDGLFSSFDEMTVRHGIEKIKTIGDAYMVAGGLPEFRSDHAEAVARMALEMRDVVAAFRTPSGDRLGIRIGINSGPVVAGVIGTRKFIYDLWGDAVNVASRMESHAQPGMIQVTESAYARLKDGFEFVPLGSVAIKGRGEMQTWSLIRARGSKG